MDFHPGNETETALSLLTLDNYPWVHTMYRLCTALDLDLVWPELIRYIVTVFIDSDVVCFPEEVDLIKEGKSNI